MSLSSTTEVKKSDSKLEETISPPTLAAYLSNPEIIAILNRLRAAKSPLQIAEQVDQLINILRTDMCKPGTSTSTTNSTTIVAYDQGMLLDDEWEANLSAKKAEELKMWGQMFDSIITGDDLESSTLVFSSPLTTPDQDPGHIADNAIVGARKSSCDDLMFANLVTIIYCSGQSSFSSIAPDLIVGAAYDYAPIYTRQLWNDKYAELNTWMHTQTRASAMEIDAIDTIKLVTDEAAPPTLQLPHPRQQYALPLYWWSRQKKLSKL